MAAAVTGSVVGPGAVAVVTGATRGFGAVLLGMLAERGVSVVVSGIDLDESRAMAEVLQSRGATAIAAPGDVTVAAEVEGLAHAAVTELGGLDLWVNNAAFESPGMRPVLDLDPETFEAITDVNALGTFRGTRAALDVMIPRQRGVVVNITGRGDDLRPARLTAAYGASKAWVRSFSRSIAAEIKGGPVRVIPVNPGIMTTERMDPDAHDDPVADARTLTLFATVTRILGDPPEVAAAALISFLDRDPSALPKELRVLGAGRVVKGLGAEVGRAGAKVGATVLPRRT